MPKIVNKAYKLKENQKAMIYSQMKLCHLSTEQMAHLLGISGRTWYTKLNNADSSFNLEQLIIIWDKLKFTQDDILTFILGAEKIE